jgi:hypothetical protein
MPGITRGLIYHVAPSLPIARKPAKMTLLQTEACDKNFAISPRKV